eukprot:CCRYP_000144-RC/>CCRYP_000144-RC protein AED:0.03 eAED:0.03 QI:422/1/1/1/0.83/0.71/7/1324/1175
MSIPPDKAVRTSTPRNNPTKVMSSNERLRAAASLSPFNTPSCMAIRRCESSMDHNPTLAAFAGPMGITVVDIMIPQRPWLVLNYASTIHDSSDSFGSRKGSLDSSFRGDISTMAFQPGPPSSNNQSEGKVDESNQLSNSILLATARGNGILIWDCSGRALSPLLGRLNASDAWSGVKPNVGHRNSQNGLAQSAKEDHEDRTPSQLSARPPQLSSTTESTQASVSTDRKSSVMSVSSASSQTTANAVTNYGVASTPATETGHVSGVNANSTVSNSTGTFGCGVVTSLSWKGPSTPILLATVGCTACLFDLRTSLFSGVDDASGGRPYARFSAPAYNNTLIHCAYSHDESLHVFSTLDSTGVVRLWDDRKCTNLSSPEGCLSSFVAHTQAGVGIAALPPPKHGDNTESVNSRWITWGLDKPANSDEKYHDLVVKIWDSLPSQQENIRAHTISTVSADEDELDENEAASSTTNSYHLTASTSMHGAIAARVHPSIPDGLLLFRSVADSVSDTNKLLCPVPGEAVADDGLVVEADSISDSPIRCKKDLSPSLTMAFSPDTPQTSSAPHPPTPNQPKRDQISPDRKKGGWEAQIMQLRNGTADHIVSFRGGGSDEDALCLAPGSGKKDMSDIIAVDLAHKPGGELLLCCLTKNPTECFLSVYGIPELARPNNSNELNTSSAVVDANKVTITSGATEVARVYKNKDSASWWNQSEEDVFGTEVPLSRTLSRVEDDTSLHASARGLERGLTQFDMETPLPVVENITNLIASEKSPTLSRDGGDGMAVSTAINEIETSVHIDFNKAKRSPCPPLCGVAFGKAGALVAFNNGPVKKMWSWYRNAPIKPNHSYTEPTVFKNHEVTPKNLDAVETNEQKTANEGHSESDIPRTLFDLIEMTSAAKIAQWGIELDNDESTNSNDLPSDTSSTSSGEDASYDDSSDESARISQSDSDGFCHVSKFDEYFASSRKSLTQIETESSPIQIHERKQFAGLTSLAPSVFVTRRFDGLILNGQSAELAQLLELGDSWWLLSDFSAPTTWEHAEKTAVTSWNDQSSLHNAPDKMFTVHTAQESSRSASMMGNLKKMFSHQSPSVAMTPPDQRLLRSKKQQNPSTNLSERQPSSSLHKSDEVPLGMYMLENPQTPDAALERFTTTRNLCLRNAKILRDMGEKSKADTWTLLAQVS